MFTFLQSIPLASILKYYFCFVEVNTPDKLEYQFFPASGGVFTFKVRSAKDAHIALTPSPQGSAPIYEIFLGGWENSKSVIRKDGQKPDVVEVPTPGILNAGEFRGFWVRWYDNVITVGHEGDAAAFLSYDAGALFPVNYVGICTGWGASGTWLIDGRRIIILKGFLINCEFCRCRTLGARYGLRSAHWQRSRMLGSRRQRRGSGKRHAGRLR